MFSIFKRKTVVAPAVIAEVVPENVTFALQNLADTFSFYVTAEAGEHFTCDEADAIALVLAVAGHREEAIAWLAGHAEGDKFGDLHFEGDEDDPDDEGRKFEDQDIERYVAELAA
ncbi:hypothetical protein [Streptomyces sp. H34-S4]|uniref:hypothetical protein n=1 Tax=Streptomyces sp. H34-S4 TaxID=2996463 RepID=UPI002271C0AC|nr:hypothetical protein [Streptomyces sp. H34-S4]MCY0933653.1 hypothetical protein [Streptomyces sp. H34-S4]